MQVNGHIKEVHQGKSDRIIVFIDDHPDILIVEIDIP